MLTAVIKKDVVSAASLGKEKGRHESNAIFIHLTFSDGVEC